MKSVVLFVTVAVICALSLISLAQDQTTSDAPAGMPPMGPPEQMKEIAFLTGTWNVDMEWRDQENPEKWNKETALCTYTDIVGGCAKQMSFTGEMMGMPFEGLMIQSYHRDKGEWQTIWVDNLGGGIACYTGSIENDTACMVAEDVWQGKEYLSRMSTFNHTETSFDWEMEDSYDSGKTWNLIGKAKYTKQ